MVIVSAFKEEFCTETVHWVFLYPGHGKLMLTFLLQIC